MDHTNGAAPEPELAPRDFDSLRALLISRSGELPKRLAQGAAFAMANPDEFAFGTAASIAERAEIQPSTLVRLAQALGYQGFSDLQAVFRDRLRERTASYKDRLSALRSHSAAMGRTETLFDGFCEAAIRSVRNLRERVGIEQIEAAVKLLARAETIYLAGQRRSYPVMAMLSYAFGKLGVKSVLLGSPQGTDAETLAFCTDRDAMIAISFTPYAAATLALVRQAAESGAPVVAITDSPFSPLVQGSRVWFEVAEADFDGFRSLAAPTALAMTLAVAIADQRQAI